MSSDFAVIASRLGKTYHLFDRPADRLKQLLLPHRKYYREFTALADASFTLTKGEVLGLVGRNGAGKSTLLQLVCGTLTPSSGSIRVNGRIAALLELGAGFNPEFSGRENVYLNASVLGLTQAEIEARYESIVDFSGIRNFIEQPVKTYSSGMYVRLAFAIATSIDPDILIVDEALSVGDGAFARKSFDRIMELKERGTTILFCSHTMYQIETLCTRALWLENGQVRMDGDPAKVVVAYQSSLAESAIEEQELRAATEPIVETEGYARIDSVTVSCDGSSGRKLQASSGKSLLAVDIRFTSDPSMPAPTAAVTIHALDGSTLASTSTLLDGTEILRNEAGTGWAKVEFTALPLLKGTYNVSAHLLCERGLHLYETAAFAALVDVEQQDWEQGVFRIPRRWHAGPAAESSPSDGDGSGDQEQDLLTWLGRHTHGLPLGARIVPPVDPLGDVAAQQLLERFGFRRANTGSPEWIREQVPNWLPEWLPANRAFEWQELFEATFGYATNARHFRWKYRDAKHPGIGLRDAAGKLIAFYGGMPRHISYLGTAAMAVQIGDVMVHPSAQGILSRNGPFRRSCATYIERAIGSGRAHLLGFGFPEARALRLAEKQQLYACVDEIHELAWTTQQPGRNWLYAVRPLQAGQYGQIDRLWTEMAAHFHDAIIGVRDAAWFDARYRQHPETPYTLWLIQHRLTRKPIAAFVLRERADDSMELIDLVSSPQHFNLVVDAARRHAARRGKKRVMAWITRSQTPRWADTHPQTHDTGVRVPISVITPGPAIEEVRNRWWLMGGDTDFR